MMTNTDRLIKVLNAEITQLRAELAEERELADRLALCLDEFVFASNSYEPHFRRARGALSTHATRRNK